MKKKTRVGTMLGVGAALAMALAAPADAGAKRFVKMPDLDGKRTKLKLRFVGYQNGKVTVEVRNTGRRAAEFRADGLYFVPKGDPERAPQRMGAVGPIEVYDQGNWKHRRKTPVPAGKTLKVQLKVFCLDSHRRSPGNGQAFSVAVKRLPRQLRSEISSGGAKIYAGSKGRYRRVRSKVQSHVWKTRNKRWIKLQGERKAEKSPRSKGRQYRRYRPRRHRYRHRVPIQLRR